MQLVVRGYEEGFNHVSVLLPKNLKPHPEQQMDYYGEFIDCKAEEANGFEAVELFGKNRAAED